MTDVHNLLDLTDVVIEAMPFSNQLVEWCKKGPGFGFVESVNINTSPPVNYTYFRIDS